jgi:hypothetical protein
MEFTHENQGNKFTFNNEETGESRTLLSDDFLKKLKELFKDKKYPAGCSSTHKNTK